jgi:BirA family biotin operon repressor/biotin-[acetyl-CoA-carboxylase] ligase
MRTRGHHQLDAAELLDGLRCGTGILPVAEDRGETPVPPGSAGVSPSRVRRVGRNVVVLPEVDSTNSYALDVLLLQHGAAADGWAIFAEYQTAGRGRLGRSWHSPRGAGLTFTVLLCEAADSPPTAPHSALSPPHSALRTPHSVPPPARLVMAAAVAVAAGIEQAADVEPEIRWPNDLYVRGKKLAGILIETRSTAVLGDDAAAGVSAAAIGIGVNCLQHAGHFPPELRGQATSLDLESPHPVDRAGVARAILRQLDVRLAADQTDDELAAAWRSRSTDIGAYVTLADHGRTFTGRIIDVQPRTGLLLQLDTGAPREFDPATTTRV